MQQWTHDKKKCSLIAALPIGFIVGLLIGIMIIICTLY